MSSLREQVAAKVWRSDCLEDLGEPLGDFGEIHARYRDPRLRQADAAIAAVLEHLIADADSAWDYFDSWYFEPAGKWPNDHEHPVADWLRSIKENPQ